MYELQNLKAEDVKLDQLLLDPNNFRFEGEKKRAKVQSKRFSEATVQSAAQARLEADGIDELKQSILTNGFLPVERIVVANWPESPEGTQKYVVLEGNRRTAALKKIRSDEATGADVPTELISSMDSIPVIVLTDGDEGSYLSIMGIRHVGGIKEWGGYQSAKLISDLKDVHKMSSRDVASTVGLSVQEVNRRYKSYKALEAMRDDDEFSEYVSADLYPLFHETLATPALRSWLKWSDTNCTFDDATNRTILYSLLSPFVDKALISRPPKITTYLQIREMKNLLENDDAFSSLVDLEQDFSDASAFVKAKDAMRDWPSKVASAANALNHMGILESKDLTDKQKKTLGDLRKIIDVLLDGPKK